MQHLLTARFFILLLAAYGAQITCAAELKLANVFTDHAVLQRDAAAPVWGWADAGAEVSVEFAGQKITAIADANGKRSGPPKLTMFRWNSSR